MDYLSKKSLEEILAEYRRQRQFSQDGVTRADGAIMAIEHLIKVSFPYPANDGTIVIDAGKLANPDDAPAEQA